MPQIMKPKLAPVTDFDPKTPNHFVKCLVDGYVAIPRDLVEENITFPPFTNHPTQHFDSLGAKRKVFATTSLDDKFDFAGWSQVMEPDRLNVEA